MDETASPGPSGKPQVLVVDDDPLIRGVLRKLLGARGCQVYEAANAGLALQAVQRIPVRLVFLDIYLPDQNGLAIMSQMFEMRPGLKIALISSDATQFDLPQAKGADVVDCIGKPFSPERIQRVLRNVFEELPVAAAAPRPAG
jgi:two-component system phosphate regulon response regulator OmpR